jgi:hypothetical protein
MASSDARGQICSASNGIERSAINFFLIFSRRMDSVKPSATGSVEQLNAKI